MNAPETPWTPLDYITEGIRVSGSLECFLDDLHRYILSLSMEMQEAAENPVSMQRRRWARNSGVLSRVAVHIRASAGEAGYLETD